MRRREIFIELTSLLDVILIMLFVLLTQARTQTADALAEAEAGRGAAATAQRESARLEQENAALSADRDEAREEAAAWQRQILSDALVLDNSLVVTLSADGTAIRLECEGEAQTIAYRWEDENYARNALRAALRQTIAGDKAVFVVFQYDRAAIYRTEYDMLREVLREIKLEARERELPLTLLELDRSDK